jgi:hypothetical protein
MRSGNLRRAAKVAPRQSAQLKGFPAPRKGLFTSQNLAISIPETAIVLENWTPTLSGIKVRGGSPRFATIDNTNTEPVRSMMSYVGASTRKLFAADATNIFDITSPADKDVAPSADVSSQTSGYYSHVNISTSGGFYMYAVNGDDYPQLYDGSTWQQVTDVSTPFAITGLSTSQLQALSHVGVYRSRLVFAESGSLNIHYLPADSVGGAAGTLSLKGVFGEGGEILFTTTWSLDSGDGLDDKLVVVTTEGEVAIYENDFADASFNKVGVYNITPPMGKNAFIKAGGDPIIATKTGMVPVSQAVTKDPAALSLSAISYPFEDKWLEGVKNRSSLPWEVVKWPDKDLAYVSQPIDSDDDEALCFVVNLLTGAWSTYKGWDTRCFALHDSQLYFGSNDSKVKKAELTGYDDDDQAYLCKYAGAWDHLNVVGATKTVRQARAIFRTSNDFLPQISGSVDYATSFPSAPNAVALEASDSLWDSGLWDEAVWDVGSESRTYTTRWKAIEKTGSSFSPQIQVTVAGNNTPTAELAVFDVTYETGKTVV